MWSLKVQHILESEVMIEKFNRTILKAHILCEFSCEEQLSPLFVGVETAEGLP